MANPIRLSEDLLEEAEKQTKQSFRSVPKQIEFWASIGKEVESSMTPADIVALANGEVEIKISRKKSEPVDFDKVFSDIEADRKSGKLSAKMVQGDVWYEESKEYPDLLVRVSNGKKELGKFKDGKFQAIKKTQRQLNR